MKKHLLLALSLGLALQAGPVNAAFVSAELRVNGLSCPFCAFGIEKKLLAVDGVQAVEVYLDEGRLALTFEGDNQATVSDLEKAVEKAGFELSGLELTVRGRLIDGAKDGPLLIANTRMSFRLAERRGEKTQPISARRLQRLRDSAGQGATILVTGVVGDWDEAQPTLALDSVEADGP